MSRRRALAGRGVPLAAAAVAVVVAVGTLARSAELTLVDAPEQRGQVQGALLDEETPVFVSRGDQGEVRAVAALAPGVLHDPTSASGASDPIPALLRMCRSDLGPVLVDTGLPVRVWRLGGAPLDVTMGEMRTAHRVGLTRYDVVAESAGVVEVGSAERSREATEERPRIRMLRCGDVDRLPPLPGEQIDVHRLGATPEGVYWLEDVVVEQVGGEDPLLCERPSVADRTAPGPVCTREGVPAVPLADARLDLDWLVGDPHLAVVREGTLVVAVEDGTVVPRFGALSSRVTPVGGELTLRGELAVRSAAGGKLVRAEPVQLPRSAPVDLALRRPELRAGTALAERWLEDHDGAAAVALSLHDELDVELRGHGRIDGDELRDLVADGGLDGVRVEVVVDRAESRIRSVHQR